MRIPKLELPRKKVKAWSKTPWDQYYLGIAKAVSVRATCPRASVGAVIVSKQNRILATGYNGAPSGAPECRDVGCLIVDDHCKRVLHAEHNAILWMSKDSVEHALGATVYIYDSLERGFSCENCTALLKEIGVAAVITSKGTTLLGRSFTTLTLTASNSISPNFNLVGTAAQPK